jgi:UDP-N-acetylmuramoyl-tripeptide--D-alanyl-D-alanine ligase
MIKISAGELAKILSGKLENLPADTELDQYPVIDSRKAKAGTFFVAFKGEQVDGHEFVAQAIKAGAKFALVSKSVDSPSILVSDVGQALLTLTEFVRERLVNMKVVGITGSQGKTTSKEFLYSILSSVGETVATEANFNTEIGVPLTMLRIVEMGARHIGEIAKLTKVVKPDVGVVLVVGSAHIGEFGSIAALANTKAELITGLATGKTAVLGSYDQWTPKMADNLSVEKIIFGENQSIRAGDIQMHGGFAHFDLVTPNGRTPVSLQVLGEHQLPNALGAAAAAFVLGISNEVIAVGLTTAQLGSKWRMQLEEVNGLQIIHDYYNANPESMKAALKTLVLLSQESGGLSWAILGKMHELGPLEQQAHLEIVEFCQEIGVDHLISMGTDLYKVSKNEGSDKHLLLHNCPNADAVLELAKNFSAGDVVLFKASRSERFEDVAQLVVDVWSGGRA